MLSTRTNLCVLAAVAGLWPVASLVADEGAAPPSTKILDGKFDDWTRIPRDSSVTDQVGDAGDDATLGSDLKQLVLEADGTPTATSRRARSPTPTASGCPAPTSRSCSARSPGRRGAATDGRPAAEARALRSSP
jgi:hypothetical protein